MAGERRVAVTRLDRRHVAPRRAIGPSRPLARALIAALALLLAGAVAGSAAHSSALRPDPPAHAAIAAHLGGVALSIVGLPHASGKSPQSPTSPGPVPGAPSDRLPAALLSVLLLALIRLTPAAARSAYAIPLRRGPPRFAFSH